MLKLGEMRKLDKSFMQKCVDDLASLSFSLWKYIPTLLLVPSTPMMTGSRAGEAAQLPNDPLLPRFGEKSWGSWGPIEG